jgi:hypothetical protein
MDIVVTCSSCGRAQTFADVVPFRAECEACAADLHSCATCRFHDRFVDNECREDQADPVARKDRRNLCEYWKPKAVGAVVDDAAAAKAKLAALFGVAVVPPVSAAAPAVPVASSSAADEAKRKLDELFKKKP